MTRISYRRKRNPIILQLNSSTPYVQVSASSGLSDSSSSSRELEGGPVLWRGEGVEGLVTQVERNDSGVGSDSGRSGSSARAGEGAKEVVQVEPRCHYSRPCHHPDH